MDSGLDSGIELGCPDARSVLPNDCPCKLLVISSKIRSSSSLLEAARHDVLVLPFRYEKVTYRELAGRIRSAAGQHKLTNVAFLVHSETGSLRLAGADKTVICGSVCPSVCLSVCRRSVCLSVCCRSVCLSVVGLSVCQRYYIFKHELRYIDYSSH